MCNCKKPREESLFAVSQAYSSNQSFLQALWQRLEGQTGSPRERTLDSLQIASGILQKARLRVLRSSPSNRTSRYLAVLVFGWNLRVSVEFESAKQEFYRSSQLTSSFNSHTRPVTPPPIAGVTLRVECTQQKL